jgi:toxin CcdB
VAQLDVFRTSSGEYLLDFQADILSHLNTRFVIPLASPADGPTPAARLNPIVTIDGEPMALYTQFAMTVPVADLTERVASLTDKRFMVMAALNLLISGY